MTSDLDRRRTVVVDNYRRVVDRVAEAAVAAGRDPAEVRIVGVSKYVDVDTTAMLAQAGCIDLGESRPQSLAVKAGDPRLQSAVYWHLVGHLQRNKVGLALARPCLIHSVDSVRLLQALNVEAEKLQSKARVLLEFNCSGDPAKHGFAPAELESVLQVLPTLPRVEVTGLMTMAALEGGPAVARGNFADLRRLRDATRAVCPHLGLPDLSMGMSDDFVEAIHEGATLVRIGSLLFRGLLE